MRTGSGEIQRSLQILFRFGNLRAESDGRLLECCLVDPEEQAEAAYRILVERHGPMVLTLCRRILRNDHDAEDAAQATFLVLATRAVSLRRRDSLGSWLFGVAHRIARRARSDEARRRLHEARKAEMTSARVERVDPESAVSRQDLYGELNRLPEACRAPLVLCYLEGLTNEQAATRLGLPLRTLQRRLAQGRRRLRDRLERRGVASSSSLPIMASFTDSLAARPPGAWVEATTSAVVQLARQHGGVGASSTGSYLLARETVRVMFLAKLKFVTLAGLVSGAALLGVLLASSQETESEAAKAVRSATANPADAKQVSAATVIVSRKPEETSVDETIEQSIRGAVLFLKAEQQPDGSWRDVDNRVQQGTSALVTYALLAAGEPVDDPHVERALDNLGRFNADGLGMTYSVALRAAALSRADPRRYRARIVDDIRWLEEAQIKPRDRVPWAGSWTYDIRKTSQGDNSNTQYALLGLQAAHEAGFPVSVNTWRLAREYWIQAQRQTGVDVGGWGYFPNDRTPASGNMTCAGVASLIACDAVLADDREGPTPEDTRFGKNVLAGLDWLAGHFQVHENPGKGRLWTYSYLASLARMGRFSGLQEIGGHDWYREGVHSLLKEIDREAGGRNRWTGLSAEQDPLVATSFVLLFLADARVAVPRPGGPTEVRP